MIGYFSSNNDFFLAILPVKVLLLFWDFLKIHRGTKITYTKFRTFSYKKFFPSPNFSSCIETLQENSLPIFIRVNWNSNHWFSLSPLRSLILLITSDCKPAGIFSNNWSSNALVPRPSVAERKLLDRSEERRVGKECRSRWSPYH